MSSKLFDPVQIGAINLKHRVALAPLTRLRADDDWVPLPMVKEYYEQRASVPGTLLISEGTLISYAALGRRNVPAIFTEAQIAGWRKVTDAVHAKGSFIFCQLWHLGRGGGAGTSGVHEEKGTKMMSSSAVAIDDEKGVPEEMTEEDIARTIQEYATAAKNAVLAAGFDGVEIHAANGYLIDQFSQDVCNRRKDSWGGSVENRARFAIAVAKAVADAVGADRTGIRLSPFSEFQGMLMEDPYPQFEHIVARLKPLNLAYLHLVEPRISGNVDVDHKEGHSIDSLLRIWDNQSPVVVAGGFSAENAQEVVDETWKEYDIVIAFGRYFISTPDLVFRLKEGIELTKYDRDSFYIPRSPKGYIDYPFSSEFLARAG